MSKGKNDIEKYLKGELTAAEMHALEKEALRDPFLAEALEGGEQLSAIDFSKDVAELNERIMKRKQTSWTWPVRIAASLLLLVVCSFIFWIAQKQDPEQTLALEQNIFTPTQDSIVTAPIASETERPKEESVLALSTESKAEISATRSKKRSKKSPERTPETKETEFAPRIS
jgi:hypothetical protein